MSTSKGNIKVGRSDDSTNFSTSDTFHWFSSITTALKVDLIKSFYHVLDPGGFRVHANPDVAYGLQTVTEVILG